MFGVGKINSILGWKEIENRENPKIITTVSVRQIHRQKFGGREGELLPL